VGIAAINAITAAVVAIVHYFATMPASHAIGWLTLAYFIVKAMPAKIPTNPQELWTWQRDALQGFVETKGLPSMPNHPTQPAPSTPEQTKPTP
jgi:hypothetical protein